MAPGLLASDASIAAIPLHRHEPCIYWSPTHCRAIMGRVQPGPRPLRFPSIVHTAAWFGRGACAVSQSLRVGVIE